MIKVSITKQRYNRFRAQRIKPLCFDNKLWSSPYRCGPFLIYQVGDLKCVSNHKINFHVQRSYDIIYTVSGKGNMRIDSKMFVLSEGDLFVVLPGQQHEGCADVIDPFRIYFICLDIDEKASDQNWIDILHSLRHMERPVVKDRYGIANVFMNLFNELINKEAYYETSIRNFIEQLLIFLYRNVSASKKGRDRCREKHLEESMFLVHPLVYEVLNYIDTHFLKIKNLSELSDIFGYNYSYLSNLFSKEMGYSITHFYNKKRFQKALELLSEKRYTITEIAHILNYESVHAFSMAFKKEFGLSPTQYIHEENNIKKTKKILNNYLKNNKILNNYLKNNKDKNNKLNL